MWVSAGCLTFLCCHIKVTLYKLNILKVWSMSFGFLLIYGIDKDFCYKNATFVKENCCWCMIRTYDLMGCYWNKSWPLSFFMYVYIELFIGSQVSEVQHSFLFFCRFTLKSLCGRIYFVKCLLCMRILLLNSSKKCLIGDISGC